VEELLVRVSPLLNLHVRGWVIRTTPEHPFYVDRRGWIPTGMLEVGDLLRSHDGQFVPVEAVASSGEVTTVYNVRVAEYHTYFVGSERWGFSVWAHNYPTNGPGGAAGTLPNDANVVRGGIQTPTIGTHPSGVTGISVHSAPGVSVADLSQGLNNGQVRATTVGAVRQAGGDVIVTSGQSAFHATLTGLTPQQINAVLGVPIPNPARLRP
jgi:hypothetical protein